jgi:hypothetical protein
MLADFIISHRFLLTTKLFTGHKILIMLTPLCQVSFYWMSWHLKFDSQSFIQNFLFFNFKCLQILKLATDFYWQPSYLLGIRSSLCWRHYAECRFAEHCGSSNLTLNLSFKISFFQLWMLADFKISHRFLLTTKLFTGHKILIMLSVVLLNIVASQIWLSIFHSKIPFSTLNACRFYN